LLFGEVSLILEEITKSSCRPDPGAALKVCSPVDGGWDSPTRLVHRHSFFARLFATPSPEGITVRKEKKDATRSRGSFVCRQ